MNSPIYAAALDKTQQATPAAVGTVLLVAKCHLAVGFAWPQAEVTRKYFEVYYPAAMKIAADLRQAGGDRYTWTTGNDSSLQAIENVRPQGEELSLYSPVGRGFTPSGPSTGTSFGIIALVENPDQLGQVLLIAGIGGESTEAAGRLATNISELSVALQKCHPGSNEPLLHFEILLQNDIMAGSPSNSKVIACHILSSNIRSGK